MQTIEAKDLTPREQAVLRLISKGMDCQAVARHLAISPQTARKHRSNILAKTGLRSAAQLAMFAVEWAFHPGGRRLFLAQPLTRREREIAESITAGKTSKQIARDLGISDLTVRKHRENLYRKLGIQRMAQLVLYCLQHPI
jgi:DNA-binding NarL/FixJ family response regulator